MMLPQPKLTPDISLEILELYKFSLFCAIQSIPIMIMNTILIGKVMWPKNKLLMIMPIIIPI